MIRPPSEYDGGAIVDLLDAAFAPSRYESTLRSNIKLGEQPHWEWVMEWDEKIVGHILYTQATDEEGTAIGYHLAPLAIHPSYQKRGLGSQLVRDTLAHESLHFESIFVLGDPAYYERFGFVKTTSARCPFDENNVHFRALRWQDRKDPFVIGYATAFD